MASDTNWFFAITMIFLVTTVMIPIITASFQAENEVTTDLDSFDLDFVYFKMDIYERGWFSETFIETIEANVNANPPVPIDTFEDEHVRIGINLNNNQLSFEGVNSTGKYRVYVEMSYFSEEELSTILVEDSFTVDVSSSFGLFSYFLNKGLIIFDERNQGINSVNLEPGDSFSLNLNLYSDVPGVFETFKIATYNVAEDVLDRVPGNNLFKLYVEGIKGMPILFNIFYFGMLGYMVGFITMRFLRGQ